MDINKRLDQERAELNYQLNQMVGQYMLAYWRELAKLICVLEEHHE